jgi:hypothetical protein
MKTQITIKNLKVKARVSSSQKSKLYFVQAEAKTMHVSNVHEWLNCCLEFPDGGKKEILMRGGPTVFLRRQDAVNAVKRTKSYLQDIFRHTEWTRNFRIIKVNDIRF